MLIEKQQMRFCIASFCPAYLYSMANKFSGWDDTIVAVATPPGIGAIGVIRLSGAKALQIINTLFSSKDL